MKANESILQDALKKELTAADSAISTALWSTSNSEKVARSGKADNRATAIRAIKELQAAIDRYDVVAEQLDALENGTLSLSESPL